MCGICGTYDLVDEDLLKRMCGAIAHRGPDDEGHYVDSDVMLGMRRLRIIDIETGSQPIYNEDRNIVVVFNGEIYNYKENREFLEKKEHRFYTQSDTETIVHMYEEFGIIGCVERLRGMFAFALWDRCNKTLFLARDRLGIKPLYYHLDNGKLLFSSEIKSLLEYKELRREVNLNAVHDYLTYMCVPAPQTIFKDIYKLEPGCILICKNGETKVEKFWDVSRFIQSSENISDEREISYKLSELMKESIRMHLISDVPLGVFLSGGLDSATIVAMASEVMDRPIKTFSIGFEEKDYSEIDNARIMAKRFNTDHHEFIVRPLSIEEIVNIISTFDEPFADSSAIPTHAVSKCAREYVTVALSGDGGDEIFGGYGNYRADKIGIALRNVPGFTRRGVRSMIGSLPASSDGKSSLSKIMKILDLSLMPPEKGHLYWLAAFSNEAKRQLYSNNALHEYIDNDSLNFYGRYFDSCISDDFINRCICVDIKGVLQNDYLTKIDRMSMANSLEVRVPFLDHKLLEFAVSISSKFKLNGFTTKYLLKKVMKDKLPGEIINGKKKGFSIPLSKWFKEDFSILIQEFLSENAIKKRGYFNFNFVKRMVDNHLSGKQDNSKQLWTLICYEIWHSRFVGG